MEQWLQHWRTDQLQKIRNLVLNHKDEIVEVGYAGTPISM
jgi:hypothetical protein